MARYLKTGSSLGTSLAIAGLVMIVAVSFAIPFIPAARAATVDVSISGDAFHPQTITVSVGDTVRWTNDDAVEHTVTSDTGAWTEIILPGGTGAHGSFTFNTANTYPYHCSIHTFMTGSVIVGSVVPEFSGEFFVVIGLVAVMFGLMAARRKQT